MDKSQKIILILLILAFSFVFILYVFVGDCKFCDVEIVPSKINYIFNADQDFILEVDGKLISNIHTIDLMLIGGNNVQIICPGNDNFEFDVPIFTNITGLEYYYDNHFNQKIIICANETNMTWAEVIDEYLDKERVDLYYDLENKSYYKEAGEFIKYE